MSVTSLGMGYGSICQRPRCWWQILLTDLQRNYSEWVPCGCRPVCTNSLVWWLENVSVNCTSVCASMCVSASFSCSSLYFSWFSSLLELSSVTWSDVSFPCLTQQGKIIQNEVSYCVPLSSVPNSIIFSKCNPSLYVFCNYFTLIV